MAGKPNATTAVDAARIAFVHFILKFLPELAAAAAFFHLSCARRRKPLVELVERPLREPSVGVAGFGEILRVGAVGVGLEIFRPAEDLVHDEDGRIVARLIDVESYAVLLFAKTGLRVLHHALAESLDVLGMNSIDRYIGEHGRILPTRPARLERMSGDRQT